MVEEPGASFPFSLEPILVDLEGGRYIGLIIPASLADLVAVGRPAGGSVPKSDGGDSSGSGNKKPSPKVASTGGSAPLKEQCYEHLPSL